ncbi:hypothetical protein [Acanthopleuribacter pedis]|uniref:Uncharacterized protein n=1 Tax=Acanthopleuribacter pedis TaxID=442870 RepID=A0A8J7QFM8_9BACT|nr:hypothetical protein [Acanthopleuribacter pedis]MBO1317708.1 hypothetical protein [Acanthopleuribacter pedis]
MVPETCRKLMSTVREQPRVFNEAVALMSMDLVLPFWDEMGLFQTDRPALQAAARAAWRQFHAMDESQRREVTSCTAYFLNDHLDGIQEHNLRRLVDWLHNIVFAADRGQQQFLTWQAALLQGLKGGPRWSGQWFVARPKQLLFEEDLRETIHYRTTSPIDDRFPSPEQQVLSAWDQEVKASNVFGDLGESFDGVELKVSRYYEISRLRMFFIRVCNQWQPEELDLLRDRARQVLLGWSEMAFMAMGLVHPTLLAKPCADWSPADMDLGLGLHTL